MEKKSVVIAFFILTLLAIGGASAGIYYYYQYRSLNARVQNPGLEAQEVLAKVGKLIDLPQGEEPTIATVKTAEALRGQPFFAKAQDGHRVILYTNARLAILFDEKNNKLINVGTINVGTPSGTPVAPPAP